MADSQGRNGSAGRVLACGCWGRWPQHVPLSSSLHPEAKSTVDVCRAPGSRLLVSATNNKHQLFSTLQPEAPPSATFEGHIAGSFYVRACFSDDGRHILSGSSNNAAYIWEVRPYSQIPAEHKPGMMATSCTFRPRHVTTREAGPFFHDPHRYIAALRGD